MKSQLKASFGQYSTAGVKPENQDFHGALHPEGADLASKGVAVCIADGISTSRQGGAAAETSVKTFLTDYICTSPTWSVRTSGERVIHATNSWMHAQNRREIGPPLSDGEREQGLICTFSALILKSRSAHIFHVGDARIARLTENNLEEMTEPHRVNLGGGESYLGRALGMDRNVDVDYRQLSVSAGDLFMLSTDGVHEFVTDALITSLIASSEALDIAAKAIVDAALEAGSGDNLTVQLVRIDSLPDGEIDDLIGNEETLPPAPALQVGQEFEGYKILRELHSGSRSHVYLALDNAAGKEVALKVLSTEQAQDPVAQTSLMLEEWVMRRLEHPNLLSAGPQRTGRRFAYSVSEYVDGKSLYAWMQGHKEPELVDVRGLIKQITTGLDALHRREMVHRDLRPQNIIVDEGGKVRIIDFGSVQVAGLDELAPQALEAAFAGTVQYSAPELYLGYPATALSDQFSLGVIAYQMLTGELPYGPRLATANTRAAQRKLRYTPVTRYNPDVPDWMDAAICKAVSVEPNRRYDEIWEFVTDLSRPNRELHPPGPMPFFHSRSVHLWQAISAVLAVSVVVLLVAR